MPSKKFILFKLDEALFKSFKRMVPNWRACSPSISRWWLCRLEYVLTIEVHVGFLTLVRSCNLKVLSRDDTISVKPVVWDINKGLRDINKEINTAGGFKRHMTLVKEYVISAAFLKIHLKAAYHQLSYTNCLQIHKRYLIKVKCLNLQWCYVCNHIQLMKLT